MNGTFIKVRLALVAFFLSVSLVRADALIDVTTKVAAAVKNNAIKTPVNHFGPPVTGKRTRVKVEYAIGESVQTNFYQSSAMLDLKAPPGKRLIILKATFGEQ